MPCFAIPLGIVIFIWFPLWAYQRLTGKSDKKFW